MLEKIINADDFGISPGVNKAIITAHQKGVLNSTSLMVNVAYTNDAVNMMKENPSLKVGVHVNLTQQKEQSPIASPKDIPLLVDENGKLKFGFVGLFLESLKKGKEFSQQVEIEMKAQIEKAKEFGVNITHLDSHRHVHMIPAIFKVAQKMQKEYNIERLRIVNESWFHTLLGAKSFDFICNGGFIKYGILKTFYYLNRTKSDTYFYSILYTTRLFGKNMSEIRVPKRYKAVEIGIHPSVIAEDEKIGSDTFSDYLLYSQDRQEEFETTMDKNLLKRIVKK